jgi:hypothetical protein
MPRPGLNEVVEEIMLLACVCPTWDGNLLPKVVAATKVWDGGEHVTDYGMHLPHEPPEGAVLTTGMGRWE